MYVIKNGPMYWAYRNKDSDGYSHRQADAEVYYSKAHAEYSKPDHPAAHPVRLKPTRFYLVKTAKGWLDNEGHIVVSPIDAAVMNRPMAESLAWIVSGELRRVKKTPIEPTTSFAKTGADVGKLVEEKQKQYGDSHGKAGAILTILYPDGIRPEQFAQALTVTRVVDKLFRIATDNDPTGEDPWRDVAGYSLLQLGRS